MVNFADRIFVIDSNNEDLQRLTSYLNAKGYVVHALSSLSEAIDMVNISLPDLIFADISNNEIPLLPCISKNTSKVPLIIVSKAELSGDVVACLRAGATDFILKPVKDYASVDHVIHRILDKIRLAKQNKHLQEELELGYKKLTAGIQELRTDQKAGLQIQKKMLPKMRKTVCKYLFEHRVKPSLYLSGDFLDYFNLDANRCLFYFADVSGHGASSAFATVLLKNLSMRLKRNLKRGSSDHLSDPSEFLQRVNDELITTDLGKHATMFVGVLDNRTNELSYSVAGHFPFPIMTLNGKAEYLEGKGMAVGLLPNPEFEVYKKILLPGFKIIIFSDGILEVIPEMSLSDKEKLLLEVVSKHGDGIDSLLVSLGLDHYDNLPDDIAVMSVLDKRSALLSGALEKAD
ncbi:MAG: sigma-B regulation protein RsbU (phosphoserine phosphatase) [Oleiphilaceae bacterium]